MQASRRRIAGFFPVFFKIGSPTREKRDQKRFAQRPLSGWIRTTWKVGLPAVALCERIERPAFARSEPNRELRWATFA
jgi:hypothetical protein